MMSLFFKLKTISYLKLILFFVGFTFYKTNYGQCIPIPAYRA